MNSLIPTIEPLPGPAMWARVLFETPHAAAGAILAIGLMMMIVWIRRGLAGRAAASAGAGAAIAGALMIVATLVTTEHEKILALTATLVASATSGDTGSVGEIIAEDARLFAEGAPTLRVERAAIIAAVRSLDERVRVREASVTRRTASVDGPNAGRSRVVVRTNFAGGGLNFTSWEIGWRLEPDGAWRATRIEALSVNGRSPGGAFIGELSRF